MKKRLLATLLCAVMALSLGACGDSNTDDTQKGNDTDVKQPSITKLADYKDLSTILTGTYEVTDEKVRSYFSNIVYSAGIGLIEVKDRDTVQEGDIVKTDYKGILDGKAFDGGSAKDQWIDVKNNCGVNTSTGESSGGFIDGFTKGLVGAKVGQTTSSQVTFPDNYGNKDLAGKLTTFEFTVKGIYEELTPETITDAMVTEKFKKSYDVTTAADFIKVMEQELAYNLVINYVIEKSTFEIPESYLNKRLEEYQNLFTELYCTQTDIETYLGYYGTTVDAMKAEWASALQSQIKAELVFEAIVKDAGLQVDEKALADYITTMTAEASGEGGNPFYTKEDNIYRMLGVGNIEAGKAYFLNQKATREYVIENYK
jgi:FKBP-type peptidyl-prolyl cis-trans isomerase (trigger factor)